MINRCANAADAPSLWLRTNEFRRFESAEIEFDLKLVVPELSAQRACYAAVPVSLEVAWTREAVGPRCSAVGRQEGKGDHSRRSGTGAASSRSRTGRASRHKRGGRASVKDSGARISDKKYVVKHHDSRLCFFQS